MPARLSVCLAAFASAALVPGALWAQNTPPAAATMPEPSDIEKNSLEYWQKRAVVEFPALGAPGSDLNLRFLATVRDKREKTPGYFLTADWPYLLAKELAASDPVPVAGSIIPGLDAAMAGRDPQELRQKKTPVFKGKDLAALAASGKDTPFVGKRIFVEGIVNRVEATAMATEIFYILLEGNIICEVPRTGFTIRDNEYNPEPADGLKLRFDGARVFALANPPLGTKYMPMLQPTATGEVFGKGTTIIVEADYDGVKSLGVKKGPLLRRTGFLTRKGLESLP